MATNAALQLLAAVAVILSVCSPGAHSLYHLDAAAIRQVLESAMRCQSLRQLHASVVHRDKELLRFQLELQPNGEVKDIVDTKLLYLASVSKGMFSTGLVRVEQHLREITKNASFSLFTTPIKQLIGDDNFWFLDHGRTELVTIDDMLSHRTGLARHDAMWYLFEWKNKEDFIRRASRLKASTEFRGSFVYNNIVWTIADLAVQKLTNRSFVNYMREFLWRPLGMGDTFGSSEMQDAQFSRVDTKRFYRPFGLPFRTSQMERSTHAVEAAGGILSSLPDMVKYMRLHASRNYSAYETAPGQFRPLNALAAESGFNMFFNKALYNDDVTDLPDWEIESYGRGWMRTWHRNHLDYSHGGSLLGVRCELDIFAKLNFAVFNHMTMNASASAPYQALYAVIINKHIADLLIRNQSFVTSENVCTLLKNQTDNTVERIQRRQLTDQEVDTLKGSYGNYGFGSVAVTYNATLKTFRLVYGIAMVELIPVALTPGQQEPHNFFIDVLEPLEYASDSLILQRTDEEIVVLRATQQSPTAYLTVRRDASGKMVMTAPLLEQGLVLQKDVSPDDWVRPKLCPDEPKSAAARHGAVAAVWLGALALAVGSQV